MVAPSTLNVVELTKRNYSDGIINLVPSDDLLITKDIPFSQEGRTGDEYVLAIRLSNEVGITFAGSGNDLLGINPACSGVIRQARVKPYISMLRTVIPFQTISRTEGGGDVAFVKATQIFVKNNVESHKKFLEIVKIHGQSNKLLGRVNYYSGTYKGVGIINGGGTYPNTYFGSVTLTAGVDTTNRYFQLHMGDIAPGIWVGMAGVKVKQLLAADLSVVAEGKLLAFDSYYGIGKLDFVPVAATAIGSHIFAFEGMEIKNEMVGIKAILKNTGTLFNISAATYPLWKGNVLDNGALKLTPDRIETALAIAVNAGGLEGNLTGYVNPQAYSQVISSEAMAKRQYDYSFSDKEIKTGTKAVRIAYPAGDVILKGHRYIMEGDALLLQTDDWLNSGSQDISLSVKGVPEENLMYFLQDQAGYVFHTYSDQYMLCRKPCRQILVENINYESAT